MNAILTKINHFQPQFKNQINMRNENNGNMKDLIKFVDHCHKNIISYLETFDYIQVETSRGLYHYSIFQTYIKRKDIINSKFKYYHIS